MAEPARKTPRDAAGGFEEEPALLQRWVERPDGRMELRETPLTPEDYLDPQIGDTMIQGRFHSLVRGSLFMLLHHHFELTDPDVIVLEDVKHLLGPGLPGPAPDISIIRGARDNDLFLESYDVVAQGTPPCLAIEVVSPKDSRIRRTDEVDKVELYQKVGIREYLLVHVPRRIGKGRFRLQGYRLGPDRRYRPLEPDPEGRLLSETTELRFGISPQGDRVDVFDARTGARLLNLIEQDQARKAEETARKAEETARKAEETARKEAEAENERLRAEIERLKKSG